MFKITVERLLGGQAHALPLERSGETTHVGGYSAFDTVYRLYFDDIYRYVYYKLSQQSEAEDITSQVFLRALEAFPKFKGEPEMIRAWLFRIAHNMLVDHYRVKSRRINVPLEAVDLRGGDEEANPEITVELKIRDEAVQAAIRHLTDDQAQVIILRYFLHYSNAEVATILGKNEGSIKALHHRALGSLSRLLNRKDTL